MSIMDYIRVNQLSPRRVYWMYGSNSVYELTATETYIEMAWEVLLFGNDYWKWTQLSEVAYCRVEGCDEVTDFYPNLWDERLQLEYAIQGVCHAHCPGHEFEYDSDIQSYACIECGEPAPDDFYYD